MAKTAVEKIIGAHAGQDVAAGDVVTARVDRVLLHDVTGPIALDQFEVMGARRLADPDAVVLVNDHIAPAKDVVSATNLARMRDFATAHGARLFDAGAGIEHTLLPEQGLVAPGGLVIGTDSHTCTAGAFGALGVGLGSSDIAAAMALGSFWLPVPATIRVDFRGVPGRFVAGKDLILAVLGRIGCDGSLDRALEFTGEGIGALGMEARMALCNMAVEASATTCFVPPDAATRAWAEAKGVAAHYVWSDADAVWDSEIAIDLAAVGPLCARPFSPGNVASVERVVREVGPLAIQQVYIGNCSNGTLTDLRQAASVLRGRRVAPGVTAIAVPATRAIYRAALAEGVIDTLLEAGAIIGPPTCGACAGLHMGVLAAGQRAVATINRNFRGRMGAADAEIYLANAYVAAACAVAGRLAHPAEVMGEEGPG